MIHIRTRIERPSNELLERFKTVDKVFEAPGLVEE